MPTLASNGIELDYQVRGAPDASPLLLVMGLGMPAAMWPDPFVDALVAEGFRVVTFDNRDSGGSTRLSGTRVPSVPAAIARALLRRKVRSPYTLDDMAADTAGLLDGLGIERAHVVGASMGGMIAQVWRPATRNGCASLTSIMSSTGNPRRKVAFGTRRALGAILRTPPPASDIPATVDHLERLFTVIGSPGFPQDPPRARQHFERVARRGLYREGTARQMLAILGSGDRRELLRTITAPTYVIHGGDDPLVPLAAGLDTARCIPGARLEVIMGMGHDFPPVLLGTVATKIARHCRDAAARPAALTNQASPGVAGPATSRMILPMCALPSISRCAAAASDIGNTAWITGPARPASSAGQTFSRSAARDRAFLGGRARPHRRARDRQALAHHQEQVEVLGLRAMLGGHLDEPAVHREALEVALEIGRADDVDDHVDAAPAGQARDALGEILVAVIDGGFGAEPDARRAFLVAARGGVRACAELARQLDRGDADAARAAVHQHRSRRVRDARAGTGWPRR